MLKRHIKNFIIATLIGGPLLMGGALAYAQGPLIVLRGTVTTPDGAPINRIRFRGGSSGVWLHGVTRECIRLTSIGGATNNTYRLTIYFQNTSACLVQMNAATVNTERLAASISSPTGYVFRPR